MRRTPLKRGTKPLKRHARLSPRRKTPRRSGRVRDTAYMIWVRSLPCCALHRRIAFGSGAGGLATYLCLSGDPIEAHHAGKRAAGRKADDDTCIPLCRAHHRSWHAGGLPWLDWHRVDRREWADARIAETQSAYRAKGAAA